MRFSSCHELFSSQTQDQDGHQDQDSNTQDQDSANIVVRLSHDETMSRDFASLKIVSCELGVDTSCM